MSKEIWRLAKGLEHLYEVSNLGRVRSVERMVKTGYGGHRKIKVLLKKPFCNGRGYLCVHASLKPRKNKYVHRLVLETFIGSAPAGYECNHKNGIKSDNRLENLEWCTRLENIRHAIDNKLINSRGENSCRAKLTEDQVRLIRRSHKDNPKFNKTALSRKLGVADGTIRDVINRKSWKHLSID